MSVEGQKSAVIVLSGGLDSTVAAYMAAETARIDLAITFDYGQKARRRELAAGYAVAQRLGAVHRTVELPFFRAISTGALLEQGLKLPEPKTADLDDVEGARASAKAVWVPNRNGIMIAVAAAWAEKIGAAYIVLGFNAEEAATFPDNSQAFIDRQNAALEYSTANGVKILAPTAAMTKIQIVAWARDHQVPLELVWSCYDGDDLPCGRCESCRRFDRAVDAVGIRALVHEKRKGWKR